jgi:hydrogenase assembly chaperone HypC/HupF
MTRERKENPPLLSGNKLIEERARTAQASPLYHSTPLSLPLDDRDSIVSGSYTSCSLDGEGHCITCSDEAVQVRVVSVNEENGLALVTVDGVEEEVDVTLVEQIAPGDLLLVHGGVAIGYVDEESNA